MSRSRATPAIECWSLAKCYRVGARQARPDTLMGAVAAALKGPVRNYRALRRLTDFRDAATADDVVWALRGLDLRVGSGETLGVIGRNGAGKSTLLKVLSRVTVPTSGRARLTGRVASLLEVGTGFHPELTGRENVYLNGTILGMRRREIDRQFDEIVAFSGVERFIDTPVKRYSSGMQLRLAFAVAAHLQAEILLVDELLAVGDVEFQRRCLGRIGAIAREGRCVVFVTHNLAAVRGLCDRAVLLDQGQVVASGLPREVVSTYIEASGGGADASWEPGEAPADETIALRRVRALDASGRPVQAVDAAERFSIELEYEVFRATPGLHVDMRVGAADGTVVLTTGDLDDIESGEYVREPGWYRARCEFPGGLLVPGTYHFSVGAHVPCVHAHLYADRVVMLRLERTRGVGGVADEGRLGVISPQLPWAVEHTSAEAPRAASVRTGR